jgi:hypothetical protein
MRQHLPAEMNVVQATELCKRPSLFGGIIYGQPSLAILYLATSCLKVVLDHSTTSAAHQRNPGSQCPRAPDSASRVGCLSPIEKGRFTDENSRYQYAEGRIRIRKVEVEEVEEEE